MTAAPQRSRQRRRALRRAAALICAGAYLLSGSEFFPCLLAFGASLEGSHTVHVGRTQEQLTIVLSHERGSAGRVDFTPRHQNGNALHRHGPVARMICLFSSRSAGMADHTACFAAAQVCEEFANSTLVKAGCHSSIGLVPAQAPLHPKPGSSAHPSAGGLSGPRGSETLLLLQSTVLVI